MPKKSYQDWPREKLLHEYKELLKRKKFGIVWEDKPEDVAEQCKTSLPVLKEEKKKSFVSKKTEVTHIMIESDNYHALSVLSYTHRKKIDVIYIDPPYNTGNKNWQYNNNYVDSSDSYRHSKWLSMMAKRLSLAKRLLKEDGILIVAIDDNEVHRLRMLLDELLPGHETTSVTVVHNPRGNITNNFARIHEYALFVIPKGHSVIARTKKENTSPRKLRRWGHNSTRKARPTMFYPIYVKNGKIIGVGTTPGNDYHPTSKNTVKKNGVVEVWPIDQNGIERRWNFGLDSVEDELSRMIAVESDGEIDIFLTEEDTTPKTVWSESTMEAGRNGASLVKAITGVDFPFPKSLYNVKKCLELVVGNRPNAIILDFFAGSGTTGHAVLEINKQYGGNRSFILCTNNEDNNGSGTKIAEDICYPRIRNILKGYVRGKEKIEGFDGNLKYYTTSFVDNVKTDNDKRVFTSRCTEMLCMAEGAFSEIEIKNGLYAIFENSQKILGIIYDEDAIDSFNKAAKKFKKPVVIYVFSYDHTYNEDDFKEIKNLQSVKPIPEVILNVYRRIYKELHKPRNL